MPDAALEATERQFIDLIRAGSRDTVVRLLLFSIPDVPRGERRAATWPTAIATSPSCGTPISTA